MKMLKDKVAVITGAGSGLGKAIALQMAREGALIAVNDINAQYITDTQNSITEFGGKASGHKADISKRPQVEKLCKEVIERYGRVDLIINNAGVSMCRMDLQEINWDHWNLMMNVNFWGALNCIMTFYPHLKKRKEAHIVNISSVFSLGGVSKRGPYCAAKFAVRGLTESMIQETSGTNLRVSSVLPGGIATGIALHSIGYDDAEAHRKAIAAHGSAAGTSPEKAARRIIRGIKNNRKRIIIGWDAYMLDYMIRLFPVLSGRMMHLVLTRVEEKIIQNIKPMKAAQKIR